MNCSNGGNEWQMAPEIHVLKQIPLHVSFLKEGKNMKKWLCSSETTTHG